MDKILEKLHDPEWWFTVVVAAILVGIFVVYLMRMLDKLTASFSSTVRDAAKGYAAKRAAHVEALATGPELMTATLIGIGLSMMTGLIALVAVVFVYVATKEPIVPAFFCFLGSWFAVAYGVNYSKRVIEALRLRQRMRLERERAAKPGATQTINVPSIPPPG